MRPLMRDDGVRRRSRSTEHKAAQLIVSKGTHARDGVLPDRQYRPPWVTRVQTQGEKDLTHLQTCLPRKVEFELDQCGFQGRWCAAQLSSEGTMRKRVHIRLIRVQSDPRTVGQPLGESPQKLFCERTIMCICIHTPAVRDWVD